MGRHPDPDPRADLALAELAPNFAGLRHPLRRASPCAGPGRAGSHLAAAAEPSKNSSSEATVRVRVSRSVRSEPASLPPTSSHSASLCALPFVSLPCQSAAGDRTGSTGGKAVSTPSLLLRAPRALPLGPLHTNQAPPFKPREKANRIASCPAIPRGPLESCPHPQPLPPFGSPAKNNFE